MRRKSVALSAVGLLAIVGVALAANAGHRAKSAPKILLGNSQVGHRSARERPGSAQTFGFKGRAGGTATSIRIYVGSHNRASKLIAGVYAYRNGSPTRRLAAATLSDPHRGHWNSLKIRHIRIRSGRHYGISVLGRGGMLYFRDRSRASCHGATSEAVRADALPARWHGGNRRASCAISAYVVGTARHKGRANRKGTSDNGGGSNSGGSGAKPPGSGPTAGGGSSSDAVGVAGQPSVTCSTTLNPGASVQNALAGASPGGVVCLNAGHWSQQTITGVAPASPGVTLAAAPGAIGHVNMAGITATGTVDNLTVEGINFSSSFALHAAANNVTVKHNNFQHFAAYAIELCSVCVNDGPSINNITMSYNQIDNTFYCLRVASAGGNYTFSHNVCGPGIGEGGGNDAHYIQAEGNNNVTVDNNAFEGPANAQTIANGAHLNVSHQCGNNLQFDNNIVWQTQAVAQTLLWGDDCQVVGGQANNNLFVEASSPETYSMFIDDQHASSNVTFSNNTIINSTDYGAMIIDSSSSHAHNNLLDAAEGFGGSAARSCDCSHNASTDHSTDVSWTPAWITTSWTPNNGSPWNPPPANYYKPSGISSAFGYQGAIGP